VVLRELESCYRRYLHYRCTCMYVCMYVHKRPKIIDESRPTPYSHKHASPNKLRTVAKILVKKTCIIYIHPNSINKTSYNHGFCAVSFFFFFFFFFGGGGGIIASQGSDCDCETTSTITRQTTINWNLSLSAKHSRSFWNAKGVKIP
jgi:hypothetical protein